MDNDLKLVIDNFVRSGFELLEYWNEDLDNLDDYPFKYSFDEIMVKVDKWLSQYGEDVEIVYDELKVLNSLYSRIVKNIERHFGGRDEELLIELSNLESKFNENLTKLTHAKDKEGNFHRATKSEKSINAIIVGGETVSYFYFFNNYVPYSVYNRKSDIAE